MASIIDRQKTGLSGELFVAAELLKRNFQVSLTLGNAKSIDLLVYDEKINCTFEVQVKSLRKPNYFDTDPKKIIGSHIYAFVLLNDPGESVEIFFLKGEIILNEKIKFFGKDHETSKRNGIYYKTLSPFKMNLNAFEKTSL